MLVFVFKKISNRFKTKHSRRGQPLYKGQMAHPQCACPLFGGFTEYPMKVSNIQKVLGSGSQIFGGERKHAVRNVCSKFAGTQPSTVVVLLTVHCPLKTHSVTGIYSECGFSSLPLWSAWFIEHS